ncbi:molybdopterin-dependent oxidoreductase [Streptomyces qinglanensis]|uniref:molybdopterin-dependent oxidoreductase n=1 Tax=Streptomyces qinglanensis TaxID=943816 RepID=UPI0037A885EA
MSDTEETSADGQQPAPPRTPAARAARAGLAGLCGLLAGYAALAVAELVAAAVRPRSGPLVVVGGAAIDATPTPVKDWAIRTFGSDDKFVLQLGMALVLALCAAALGVVSLRYRRAGAGGVLLFGVVGAVTALSRPEGQYTDVVPSLAGAAAGAAVLHLLVGFVRAEPDGTGPVAAGPVGRVAATGRRGFVLAAGAVAVTATGAGWLGRFLGAARGAAAEASREAVTLPAPSSRAAPVPRGAELQVAGLGDFITSNSRFYRVDTLLRVPRLTTEDWSLRIHGAGVSRPVNLDFAALLERGLIERDITMTCVSNQVGGSYVGNARWLGVPLAPLLREAGVRPPSKGGPADQLVARSEDGMTLGSPVETVMDGRDAMLAVGMNGEPLPFEHGFPVRMLVPGLYGYVSACKWLRELELTRFEDMDVYWVKRGWAREAPIKIQSRIDTPRPLADVRSGKVAVAGVAWAQHRGIARVEVRVDDAPWRTARLAEEDSQDTWRQWLWEWDAEPGSHTLQVRATDKQGCTQTADRVGTVPDGATGRHSVVVNVT